jgi:predicted GNAT family N-acyltransferase
MQVAPPQSPFNLHGEDRCGVSVMSSTKALSRVGNPCETKKLCVVGQRLHNEPEYARAQGAATMLEDFTFKTADAEERRHALRLRRDVYSGDLGHVPEDDTDDRANHFVATIRSGDIVAAFRILGPRERPFDLEQYVDLRSIAPPDRTLALIGRLCIRPDYRAIRHSAFIQMGMLKLAHTFAERERISDFVMYTFPHLLAFYRSAYFSETGQTFLHPGYRQKMHVMHLDIVSFRRCYATSDTSLARYLLHACPENVLP